MPMRLMYVSHRGNQYGKYHFELKPGFQKDRYKILLKLRKELFTSQGYISILLILHY